MSKRTTYDLAVIGTGSAGLMAAKLAVAAGGSVILIDSVKRASSIGLDESVMRRVFVDQALVAGVKWSRVVKRTKQLLDMSVEANSAEALERRGIDVKVGVMTFNSPSDISVDDERISAKKIILATGSDPKLPHTIGLKKSMTVTPGGLATLSQKPKSVAIIGAGISGVETAIALSNLGIKVHLIDHSSRILKQCDDEAIQAVMHQLHVQGVNVMTSASIPKAAEAKKKTTLTINRFQKTTELTVDAVVLATGPSVRLPKKIRSLVDVTDEGISIDDTWRTSSEHIYAIGNCTNQICGYGQSDLPIRTAVLHALNGRKTRDNTMQPFVLHSPMPLACVGMTENELARMGEKYDSIRIDYSALALHTGQSEGFIKLLTDQRGNLVSAIIYGEGAEEAIGYFAQLVGGERPLYELQSFPVPNGSLIGAIKQHIALSPKQTRSLFTYLVKMFAKPGASDVQ